ncbi:MAG: phage tail family protein [Clostridiaceae bacterium]|nr:phage tail family protein [Clostridiaceae bacterium]
MYGLKFNNKHSYNDYGLLIKSINRPISEPKLITEEIESADSAFDFSEINSDKRIKYKDKIITVTFAIKERNSANLRVKAREISRWLNCGEKQLTFDDESGMYYFAKLNNKIDLETQITVLQQFTVQFKCRPYAYSTVQSNEQIQFGQGLQFGYNFMFDMTPTVFNINTPSTISLYNSGDYVKPVIIITGTASTIKLSCGGKTLSYNSVLTTGQTLAIDCAKYRATVNSSNANNAISGNYFEFENGSNILTVSGTNLNINLTIVFRYTYL